MENTYSDHYLASFIDGEYISEPAHDSYHITQKPISVLEYTTNGGILKRSVSGDIVYKPETRLFVFIIKKFIHDGESWKRTPDDDVTITATKSKYADAITGISVISTEAVEFLDEEGDVVVGPTTDTRLKDGYCTTFDFVAKLFGVDGTALFDYLLSEMVQDADVTLP